jgi:hypothetical protein
LAASGVVLNIIVASSLPAREANTDQQGVVT